jgi:hypothetical protein
MEKNIRISQKRRRFIKGIAALPLIGSIPLASAVTDIFKPADYLTNDAKASMADLKGVLPKGKLGKYDISRIFIGCNPIGGFSHARDLRYVGTLSKNWHTPQKTKETWALAEASGINLAALISRQYNVFNEYKKETGSKMLSVCQCYMGQAGDRLSTFREAVGLGADMIYTQGEVTDNLYKTNALDELFAAMEYTRSQGVLFGVGAHSVQTIINSARLGVRPDFYFKTFHHDNYWSASPRSGRIEITPQAEATGQQVAAQPAGTNRAAESGVSAARANPAPLAGSPLAPRIDHNAVNDNIWDLFPEQTIETFKNIAVPLIGFKTMAAGAITPADGFRWAFENGADFICAGMFDFQLVDDVNTAIDVLASLGTRERPWYS